MIRSHRVFRVSKLFGIVGISMAAALWQTTASAADDPATSPPREGDTITRVHPESLLERSWAKFPTETGVIDGDLVISKDRPVSWWEICRRAKLTCTTPRAIDLVVKGNIQLTGATLEIPVFLAVRIASKSLVLRDGSGLWAHSPLFLLGNSVSSDATSRIGTMASRGNRGAGRNGTDGKKGPDGANGIGGGRCKGRGDNGSVGKEGEDGSPGGQGADGSNIYVFYDNLGDIHLSSTGGSGGHGGAGGSGGNGGNGHKGKFCLAWQSAHGGNGGSGGKAGTSGAGGDGGRGATSM